MNLLFASDTPWVWDAEATFARLKEEMPQIAHGRGDNSLALAEQDVYKDETMKRH